MRRLLRVTVVALAVVVVASGCSDSSDQASSNPNGITDLSAIAAFQEGATSTTTTTDVTVSGTLDIEGSAASMTSQFGADKAQSKVDGAKSKFEVIKSGQVLYVKADGAFWSDLVGEFQGGKIGSSWATSSVDGPLASFNYFVDLNSFFRSSARITKGEVTDVAGRPALPLTDPPSNTNSTWWFATTGDPSALKYNSGKITRLTFSYDEPVLIEVPPVDQTIDVSTIKVPKAKQG